MDMSNILVNGEWADWPNASPTSAHGINIRFYTVLSEDDDATLRFDLGADNEAALEEVYDTLEMGRQVQRMTVVEFERFMRNIFQTRLENLLPYTVILSQYAVLTTDVKEVQRSLRAEQRTLTRVLKLLPYRLLPQLLEEEQEPHGWWQRLRHQANYVVTLARLSLPLG